MPARTSQHFNNVPDFLIAGVDESGRGPLAGPVLAAAVILPEGARLPLPLDCKLFSPPRREELYRQVTGCALAWAVSRVEAEEIDRINILQATLLAMSRAVSALSLTPDLVLVDGDRSPDLPVPTCCLTGGDRLSLAVGAASIVAKVERDRIMDHYHRLYPEYGFHRHRGYGTAAHLSALRLHGPCPIHRNSFRGVRPGTEG